MIKIGTLPYGRSSAVNAIVGLLPHEVDLTSLGCCTWYALFAHVHSSALDHECKCENV